MPGGKKPGKSIKRPKAYEGLRRANYSKASAARISNWMAKRGRRKKR